MVVVSASRDLQLLQRSECIVWGWFKRQRHLVAGEAIAVESSGVVAMGLNRLTGKIPTLIVRVERGPW